MTAKKDLPGQYRKAREIQVGDYIKAYVLKDGGRVDTTAGAVLAPVTEIVTGNVYGYTTYTFLTDSTRQGLQAFRGGQYVEGSF